MRWITPLLVLAGCAAEQARTPDQYARAFDACYESVRARNCTQLTTAGRDACIVALERAFDSLASVGDRRAFLLANGCSVSLVSALDRR